MTQLIIMSGRDGKRKRQRRQDSDDDDEETVIIHNRMQLASDKEVVLSAVDEDLVTRDAFAERLRLKDASATRVMNDDATSGVQKGMTKEESLLLAKRGVLDEGVRNEALDRLREVSRQEYLKKREEKELELLEFQIKDEDYLFNEVEKSAMEKKQVALNKTILDTARTRQAKVTVEGYAIPDSYDEVDDEGNRLKKKEDLLTDRYEEDTVFVHEQEIWEDTQIKMATSKVGAQDKGQNDKNDDYEYVFEDQIEFISQQMLKGVHVSEEDIATARKKMEEAKTLNMKQTRESLPIFSYREQLLAAVRDYQILVIVGETGSGKR